MKQSKYPSPERAHVRHAPLQIHDIAILRALPILTEVPVQERNTGDT
jgi:hypothetical protein